MTRLAISDHSNLMPSDIELNREGLSYTIDTVKHFRSILPKDHEIYLMMGIDAFMEIDTWKSYTELFDLMQLIVMARPGHWCKENTMQWHILKTYLSTKVSEGYSYCASRSAYVHGEKRPVFICNVSLLDISSTKIRQLVKNNRSINMFVPEKVEEYIIKKGLYQ